MKITSKGQVTLPLALRKQLGWNQSTEVDPQLTKEGILFKRKGGAKSRGAELVAHLSGRAKGLGYTTDQLMKLLRD
jgi:bifunctional DNA-binding transcriptional regulator/antitoxin component of YhaV-PrlF toxin-antitoxin module